MPNTFFGLTIGTTGLYGASVGINTTAHNISNTETEGYSRQVVKQTAGVPLRANGSYGMIGTGVEIQDIEQQRDAYYDTKYRSNNTLSGYYAAQEYYMQSIEGHHLVAKAFKSEEMDANNNFYAYGCHWHYDEASEAYSWIDENVKFEDPYTYDRNLDIFKNAPARERGEKLYKQLNRVHDMTETKFFLEKLHSMPRDTKSVK